MSLRVPLLVALGGFVGALSRFGLLRLGEWVDAPAWSSTFAVNLVGCAAMGVVLARLPMASPTRMFVGAGVLGGFTTFSGFAADTIALVGSGSLAAAAFYLTASVSTCLLGVWLGERLTRRALP